MRLLSWLAPGYYYPSDRRTPPWPLRVLPVTLVAGRGDNVVSTTEQSVRLAGALTHRKLLIVEDAGHMVHRTANERVMAAILPASKN